MECFVSSILLEVPCFFFFLQFQLLFSDFYHFHHVIWGMKWAKKVKTKNGQNMSSGPFSHDAAHIRMDDFCSVNKRLLQIVIQGMVVFSVATVCTSTLQKTGAMCVVWLKSIFSFHVSFPFQHLHQHRN